MKKRICETLFFLMGFLLVCGWPPRGVKDIVTGVLMGIFFIVLSRAFIDMEPYGRFYKISAIVFGFLVAILPASIFTGYIEHFLPEVPLEWVLRLYVGTYFMLILVLFGFVIRKVFRKNARYYAFSTFMAIIAIFIMIISAPEFYTFMFMGSLPVLLKIYIFSLALALAVHLLYEQRERRLRECCPDS